MPQLQRASISRGGRTAPHYTFETNTCNAFFSKTDGTLNIKFDIASKGGGTTCLWVEIGAEDVQMLLMQLAESRPESAAMLSECLSRAIYKSNSLLSELKTGVIAEKLDEVNDYAHDKLYDLRNSENNQERTVWDYICNLTNKLKKLK